MNDVDVIVLDLDGGQNLVDCLDSIAAQSERPRSVIIFDNGSHEPVDNRIGAGRDGLPITILRHDRNVGFTGGINRAMAAVSAPYVGWVNNDVVLDEDWLRSLREALDQDDALGAVQPIIRGPEQTDGAGIVIGNGRYQQLGHGLPPAEIDCGRAWGVSATAAMYRSEALRLSAIAEFILHPAFFAWYEDVELSARLHEHGWKTETVPRLLAWHRGSSSASKVAELGERLRVRNRYFVNRLHPGVGRRLSLLSEDMRRIARLLFGRELIAAWRTARAVLEGLTVPVLAREPD
ncbi:MAG: glycosyltransferase family 2 protein [Acidobacteriota bacterium]